MAVDMPTLSFQEFKPDPKDLCTLCGGNYGDTAMVSCKDGMHVCMDCIGILSDIKSEREKKKRNETVEALLTTYFNAPPYDEPGEADRDGMYEVYSAIAAGKIPHLKIV